MQPQKVICCAYGILVLLSISLLCNSIIFRGRIATKVVGEQYAPLVRYVFSRKDNNAMRMVGPGGKDDSEFTNWSNPSYESKDLNKLWNERDGLLTIGSSGVSQSHINSLFDLVSQHDIVRVKLASDKIDPFKVSDEFLTATALAGRIDLLEVRRRGFMVRRKKLV